MNQQQASLLILPGAGQSREMALARRRVTIGRDVSCDLVIDSRYVSKLHACIDRRGQGYVISDPGSRNGVFVNGDRIIGPYRLHDGDEIQIGEVRMVFRQPGRGQDDTQTLELASPSGRRAPVGAVIIDETRREVWVDGHRLEIPLSRQEFALLRLLCGEAGRVYSREELGDAVWGQGNYDYNMLHRLVHRVKGKLQTSPTRRDYLISVPGVGYRLYV